MGLFGSLFMPFYNIGLGLNPALLGLVLMILQGWNAVVDPVMGNITDNAKTRWGRRKPFMVAGGIGTAIIFPFLWHAPLDQGSALTVLYLILTGMLFYSAFSCWAMPYYGLQLEMTSNYDERTSLAACMSVIAKILGLAGGWILAILTSELFNNPSSGAQPIVNGLRICSWFFAVLILIAAMLPVIMVRDRLVESGDDGRPREPFWQSIRESATCRPLWYLIAISFSVILGSSSVGVLSSYVNIYFINQGDLAAAAIVAGWKSTVLFATGILFIPLWTLLARKYDKPIIVAAMLLFSIFGHLLNYFFLIPEHPYLQLIPAFFESGAISAIWLFLPSMKADICDFDELETMRRREGSLNAFYSIFIKAALTLSAGISGLLLSLTAFDATHKVQKPEVLDDMIVLYLIVPVIIWIPALLVIFTYPINRSRMIEIRAELESRRGPVSTVI